MSLPRYAVLEEEQNATVAITSLDIAGSNSLTKCPTSGTERIATCSPPLEIQSYTKHARRYPHLLMMVTACIGQERKNDREELNRTSEVDMCAITK